MNLEDSNLSTELQLFCPGRTCLCYQSLDNKITRNGTYTTRNDNVPRQMFSCWWSKRFSETGYSQLFCKHGGFKEYEQAVKLSCLGISTFQFNLSLLKKTFKITTDKLVADKNAIEPVLGNCHYVYLQIVKSELRCV